MDPLMLTTPAKVLRATIYVSASGMSELFTEKVQYTGCTTKVQGRYYRLKGNAMDWKRRHYNTKRQRAVL